MQAGSGMATMHMMSPAQMCTGGSEIGYNVYFNIQSLCFMTVKQHDTMQATLGASHLPSGKYRCLNAFAMQ